MHTRGARGSRRAAPGPLATGGTLLTALLLVAGCAPAATVVEAPALEAPGVVAATEGTGTAAGPPAGAPAAPGPAAGEPDRTPVAGPVTEADAAALTATLSAALSAGDQQEWTAHFARADGLRARQRDWFAAVRATPMRVREVHPLLLTPARPGRDAELTVGFRHQVTGADPVPTVERYRYLLARGADGAVRVSEVDGGGRLEVDHPQLWDLVPTAVAETDHLVVLYPRSREAEVAEALPRLDLGASHALADFPVPGVERLVVTAAPTGLVHQVFGGDVEQVLGFATRVPASPTVEEHDGLRLLPSERQVVARSVVDLDHLPWELRLGTRSPEPEGGSPLMRHEGVHALMALHEPTARPARWVSEGLAGWYEVSGDEVSHAAGAVWRGSMLASHGLPGSLPPSDPVDFHDEDQSWHYALAASVFEYLEERHGTDVARDVGVALHGVSGGEPAVSAVLQERLGTDVAGLEAGWRDWLAGQQ